MRETRTDDADAPDSDAPLDPAQMYALLQNQQRSTQVQMGDFVPLIAAAWGVAWLLGFGALWLVDGVPGYSLPVPVAVTVFVATLVLAGGLSAWMGMRSGRGMRGNFAAAFTGIVYGNTWWIGGAAIGILGAGLRSHGMSEEVASFYYPCAYVVFAGIMYAVAGAIWQAVPSLVAGIWLVAVAVAASFFPYPHHYLFLALAAGVGFLALATVSALRLRRIRSAAAGGSRRG
jgi:hypothetical protein